MEYPDGCSTAIRYVVRKMGLYDLEMIFLQECNFQMGRLAYDTMTGSSYNVPYPSLIRKLYLL